MKILIVLLVLANLALFGWGHFVLGRSGEPLSAHPSVNAERVVLPGRPGQGERPAGAPPASKPATPQVCLEWGPFVPEEAASAREALAMGDRVSQRTAEKAVRWWVHLPAQRSREAALKKREELLAAGAPEAVVLQENGPWRHAVSLGVFSTEAAAEKRLAELKEKGVRTARVSSRTLQGEQLQLIVHDGSDATMANIVRLRQNWPGSDVRATSCPAP